MRDDASQEFYEGIGALVALVRVPKHCHGRISHDTAELLYSIADLLTLHAQERAGWTRKLLDAKTLRSRSA